MASQSCKPWQGGRNDSCPTSFKHFLGQLLLTIEYRDTARLLILFCSAAILLTGERTVFAELWLLSLIVEIHCRSTTAPKETWHRWSTSSHRSIAAETCEMFGSRRRGSKLRVRWYGGGWCNAEAFTGTRHWFKSGKGLVEVRWVMVPDLYGAHLDECFFSTDTSISVGLIVEIYGGRWNIEATFQEMREHLGLESTRGRHKNTVLRMEPA